MKSLLYTLLVVCGHCYTYSQSFTWTLNISDKTSIAVTASRIGDKYYLFIPGVTKARFHLDKLDKNVNTRMVRNEYLAALKDYEKPIKYLCGPTELISYGNIRRFLDYYPDDAAVYLTRKQVPGENDTKTISLNANYSLQLLRTPESYFMISETSILSSANDKELIRLLYPNGNYIITDTNIDNNTLLYNNLSKLADLLDSIDVKLKPRLYLVPCSPDTPGFHLMLYTNENKYQISGTCLIPEVISL